jgi:hypothetical protein
MSLFNLTNIFLKKSAEHTVPALIEKYPQVESYVLNLISSNLGIQLPAVLNSILEVFGRNISESDLDDPELVRYINNILIHNQKPLDLIPSDLGKGVGLYDEDNGRADNPLGFSPQRQWK